MFLKLIALIYCVSLLVVGAFTSGLKGIAFDAPLRLVVLLIVSPLLAPFLIGNSLGIFISNIFAQVQKTQRQAGIKFNQFIERLRKKRGGEENE